MPDCKVLNGLLAGSIPGRELPACLLSINVLTSLTYVGRVDRRHFQADLPPSVLCSHEPPELHVHPFVVILMRWRTRLTGDT